MRLDMAEHYDNLKSAWEKLVQYANKRIQTRGSKMTVDHKHCRINNQGSRDSEEHNYGGT